MSGEATARQGRLPAAQCQPSRYLHYTGRRFRPGDVLLPQEDGYVRWPESRAQETILERYRPPGKLPRRHAVFLFAEDDTDRVGFGALSTAYCCVCAPWTDPTEERSDLAWLWELDQGFEDVSILESDFSELELAYLAGGYWSGAARPTARSRFEYRTARAHVIACQEMPPE